MDRVRQDTTDDLRRAVGEVKTTVAAIDEKLAALQLMLEAEQEG